MSPLGQRARFGLQLDQVESDLVAYENLDLWFLFPQRAGTLGVMFRPYYDKSRQDFALTWELGADTTRDQLRLVYGLEDLFNNLWVWRQTRVGESGEPYERHPWEPAIKAALRRPRWRVETEGKWLTLARKRVNALRRPGVPERADALGRLGLGRDRGAGPGRHVDGAHREPAGPQHRPAPRPLEPGTRAGRAACGRSSWPRAARRGAASPSRGAGSTWTACRATGRRSPTPASTRSTGRSSWRRAGRRGRGSSCGWAGCSTGSSVYKSGDTGRFTYGTRNESRAYLGLMARFGRVWLSGVEGIELDPEPYEVWHHHDKGFLQLQTTF